ncbi:MucBP domain-containing protein [Furfurilactobacillus entadae]|uniref:MucBP domain-containing protein n=1 Tax=Furfurilactobacillus entadae TaxID=2922307 RepID=UPI0038B270EC
MPNDETVTINYVSTDGKNLGSKRIATKFSRIITIDQPSSDGYTISANQPTSYKVAKDGANVVTVTYAPTTSSSSSSSGSSSSSSKNVDSLSVTSNGQSSSATGSSQSNTTSSQARTVVPYQSISSSSSSTTSPKQSNKSDTPRHASLPSTAAIDYTTSIIGIAILAGVTTFFVIKKRSR